MDRLRSIAVFVRVAERGSFAAAAGDFGISGTMVGQHIRALEGWLGGRLLNRTTRRQCLTELGRLVQARCRDILRGLDDMEALGASASGEIAGQLRVMTPVSFGAHALAPVLKDYLRNHPKVEIDLIVSDARRDMVEEGIDVVVRVGELADSTMKARALAPYRSILCAAPSYLEKHGHPVTPDELTSHACLGFANPVAGRRWRLVGADGERVVPISLTLAVNSGEALRMAALSGLGIIMQPEVLVAQDLRTGGLVPVLEDYASDVRPTHVLLHPDRHPPPKVRTFVDFLTARFGRRLAGEN
ncbi:LysR family transcriptional regulator [Sphingomonas mali]|uniref:LysR family transcriptional regulator n=1 Tax=Sphingomonas mali TaxID=40682 RepID=UPI0008295A20|nr:LysR family transcriptional regulator [Sphingomonas mali]